MSLGGQTVTFITVTEDLNQRDRFNRPALVRTESTVRGCRFRPAGFTEEIDEEGDKTLERWKLTAPPVPAVLSAGSRDELRYNGDTYQIISGPRIFTDLSGRPFKVTIECERRVG